MLTYWRSQNTMVSNSNGRLRLSMANSPACNRMQTTPACSAEQGHQCFLHASTEPCIFRKQASTRWHAALQRMLSGSSLGAPFPADQFVIRQNGDQTGEPKALFAHVCRETHLNPCWVLRQTLHPALALPRCLTPCRRQELCVIVLDVGEHMHPYLPFAGRGLGTLLQSKMAVERPKELVRVVLFGTTDSNNDLHHAFLQQGEVSAV